MNLKNISKKLLLAAAALLCCAGICLAKTTPVQAAEVYTTQYDLNGDGTKETCKMTITRDSYGYISSFKLTDNGSTIYNKTISSYDTYKLNYKWIHLSNSLNFVQIYGTTDNDYIAFNWIFRYNTSTKKLVLAGNLMTYYGDAYGATALTSSTISVSMAAQPAKLGWITYELNYKYNTSTGKFSLVSPYATAKSGLTELTCGYAKYFAKSQYKTAQTLIFYSTPGSSTKAFTLTKGKWVTLTRIRVSHGTAYCEFRYKTSSGYKYGWRSGLDDYSTSAYFADVDNHLAG